MLRVVGDRANEREAASTSEMSPFETEILTTRKNLKSLMGVPGKGCTAFANTRPWTS